MKNVYNHYYAKSSLGLFLSVIFFAQRVFTFNLNRSKICRKSGTDGSDNGNHTVCKDMYTGLISIKNDQSFAFNITRQDPLNRTAAFDHSSNVGFTINIEKSKVWYSYQLQYVIDVFDRFEEDVYQYTWHEAGDNPKKFCFNEDLNKCPTTKGGLARTPDGIDLPWSFGRCCWCPQTLILETYTDYKRAKLNCNFSDLLFRKGIWVSKSCPRVFGPWYSAFEINQFQWRFEVQLNLQWWPDRKEKVKDEILDNLHSKCKQDKNNNKLQLDLECLKINYPISKVVNRTYFLNFSNPEIYDTEYDIRFRIKGGGPQVAEDPPNLSNKILFIPTYPADNKIVQESSLKYGFSKHFNESKNASSLTDLSGSNHTCASASDSANFDKKSLFKHILLIPRHYVDLTGLTCNKIGVSTRLWGNLYGRFCSHPPGTCMGNQIGTFRKEDELLSKQGKPMKYHLSTILGGNPRYYHEPFNETADLKDRSIRHYLGWNYEKEHMTEIDFEIDASEISWLRNISPGRISLIEPIFKGDCSINNDDGCAIKVHVLNSGNIKARYVVQIPFCRDHLEDKITNDIQPIDPIGKTILPNSTLVFTLTIQVLVTEARDYACYVQLFDSDHQMIDENVFNISVGNITKFYQGLQKPVISSKANVHKAKLMNNTNGIFNWNLSEFSLASDECDCGTRIFCYLKNFSKCFNRMKKFLLTVFILVGVIILLFVSLPYLMPLILSCFTKSCCFIFKRTTNALFRIKH